MTSWILLIRESEKHRARAIASQALAMLRARGVWVAGDRIRIVIERVSSNNVQWDSRPFFRWLQSQPDSASGLVTQALGDAPCVGVSVAQPAVSKFKLITAHPTRLTRHPDELENFVNLIENKGGQWLSLGVRGVERGEFIDPMTKTHLPGVRQMLDEMHIASSTAGLLGFQRNYTIDRQLDSACLGQPIFNTEAIKHGLKLLCKTRGHEVLAVVLRISPGSSQEDQIRYLEKQAEFFYQVEPAGVEIVRIRCQQSAYKLDANEEGWHHHLASELRKIEQRGKTALVLAVSLDRLTRREDGFDLFRSMKQHTFGALFWQIPRHQELASGPLTWAGLGAADVDSASDEQRNVLRSFEAAIRWNQKLLRQHNLWALLAPIIIDQRNDNDVLEVVDNVEAVEELLHRHLRMAHVFAKTYFQIVYWRDEIPDALKGLNHHTTIHQSVEMARQWIVQEHNLDDADVEIHILETPQETLPCKVVGCDQMVRIQHVYQGACSQACQRKWLEEFNIRAQCSRVGCEESYLVGLNACGAYCSKKCRGDETWLERRGAKKVQCKTPGCLELRYVGGKNGSFCSRSCEKAFKKMSTAPLPRAPHVPSKPVPKRLTASREHTQAAAQARLGMDARLDPTNVPAVILPAKLNFQEDEVVFVVGEYADDGTYTAYRTPIVQYPN